MGTTSSAKKYALLIGLNYYPKHEMEDWNILKGCVSDVQEVQNHLRRSLPDIEITMLTSTSGENLSGPIEDSSDLATYSNVTSSLEQILSQAASGDTVYIHFSGHGTALAPESPYSNGCAGDLALVLLATADRTKLQYLRGLELAFILRGMVDKGLNPVLILDCCASGSVMRGQTGFGVRFLPYSSVVDMEFPPIQERCSVVTGEVARPTHRDASMRPNWLVNPTGYAIITACGPTEIAQEIQIGQKFHGALSYFLTRAFVRYGRVGGRLEHIYAHLCARFQDQRLRQRPMLYGNKSALVLESQEPIVLSPMVPVLQRHQDGTRSFLLGAGKAHGVCTGDTYALVPFDHSLNIPHHQPILGKIGNTNGLTSDLLLPSEVRVSSGMVATAVDTISSHDISVVFELPCQFHEIWKTVIQRRPSLKSIIRGSHIAGESSTLNVIVRDNNEFQIRDEVGRRLLNIPTVPQNHSDATNFILDVVDHLVRYRLVERIHNQLLVGITHPFKNVFDARLVTATGEAFHPGCSSTGQFHPICSHSDCLITVDEGDVLKLVIRNNMKDNGKSIYVQILNLTETWAVDQILHADHEVIPQIGSNKTRNFPTGGGGVWKKDIKMTVEEGQIQSIDLLKVFLTLKPASFSILELPALGHTLPQPRPNRGQHDWDLDLDDWVVLNFQICTRREQK